MERVSVARMATAKLQGWIHAARGMGVSGSVTTELNSYKKHILNHRVTETQRKKLEIPYVNSVPLWLNHSSTAPVFYQPRNSARRGTVTVACSLNLKSPPL